MVYFHIVYLEWLRKPTKNLRQYNRCHNRDSWQAPAEYYRQHKRGRYSDSLRAGRSGDRIPVGAMFSAAVETDSGVHPTSYRMGTGSFPGVKRLGRGVDHPVPSSSEVKERVELYLYSPYGTSWPVLGRTLSLPPIQTFRSHRISIKRWWAFRFCLFSTARCQATAWILMFLDSSFHLGQV